jgi:hypothetical protein
MRWKMENPNKVKNIVIGSYEGLTDLYLPQLLELQNKGILKLITSEGSDRPNKLVFNHKRENL